MFLSKITSVQLSFSKALKRIDNHVIQESSAKIRAKKKVMAVSNIAEESIQLLSDFAYGKTAQKEILIKNVAFFQPGNIIEGKGSNSTQHYHMNSLMFDVLTAYGYSEEKTEDYIKHVFAEAFQNVRRKQVKCVFKEYSKDRWVELSKHLSEMELDHSIPREFAIRIKISLMLEGFTLRIFGPKMDFTEEERFNQKLDTIYEMGFSKNLDYSKYGELMDDTESYGYGLMLIIRILRSIHPGFYYTVENRGKYAVTEITLPRIEQE